MHLDELSEKLWTLIPFDQTQSLALFEMAQERLQKRQFRQAGLAAIQNVNDSSLQIRNDEIFWLDAKSDDLSKAEKDFLSFIENLREEIKNDFRVSLSEFECHFAFYDKGHYYQKHRDTTAANNKRVFSFVLYLNENWNDADGGHLVGYDQDKVIFRVKPELGQMILFRSDLEHEVMPTQCGRFSLTGWFRK
jgi:SM-20-related protein